jgi:protein-S-isoprenylcysteine O-methyltransferase Ste14
MQDTATESAITQLTAINVAKGLTIALLLAFAVGFGVRDFRQLLYLCLHVSYCVWWLLEQWLFPQRRQLFSEPINLAGFVAALFVVGGFYALPGLLAFMNPVPLSFVTAAIALVLYIFGSLINASADVQKLTAKQYGAGLVNDNIWRFSRNINYFGDLLRYLSFSVVAGSPWAYLVPALIVLLYLQRIQQKEQSMTDKYPDYAAYQNSSKRLIPFIW